MNGQVAQPPCLSQIYPLTKAMQCAKETGQTTWLQSRQPSAAHGGEVDKLPPSDKPVVMVVDAMAFIQCYQHLGSSTFHELQGKYLRQLLGILPDKCDCIHFVGDRYVSPAESLKGEEREKRMKTCPSKMKKYKPHDTLPIPEWKGFIHNPLNKANLLNYMGDAHLFLMVSFVILVALSFCQQIVKLSFQNFPVRNMRRQIPGCLLTLHTPYTFCITNGL